MQPVPQLSAAPGKHRNLAQSVVAYFADNLCDGALKPGDKPPTETEITRILGVGRTVVREAISHLQAGALVETGTASALSCWSRRAGPRSVSTRRHW